MPHGFFSLVTLILAGSAAAAELSLPRLPFAAEPAAALRRDWARAYTLEPEFTNSLGMKLVLIPGGRFDMGPNGSNYGVEIRKPYYLGVTEVTLGQYRRFKAGHKVEGADDEFNADDRPAAMVSWEEARAFCAWLSEQPAEKKERRLYALPTEAQWEWAARAGTTTARYFGETDKGQAEHSWFNATYTPNPKHETKGRGRQPVARLKPNAWGLYDMLGNVWEWCEDRRGDEATGEVRSPTMRGGSWRSGASHCTATAHDPGEPNQRGDNIGFRIACRIAPVKVTVDTSEVPELAPWAAKAKTIVEEWHPRIAQLLASDGFTPPDEVRLVFRKNMRGVAGTSGTTITIAAPWVQQHPDDFGMVVHELTHVIQAYPAYEAGWLVEGIADYIRFFHYEPKKKLTPPDRAKTTYRDGYRTTARFLNWVERTHDRRIVRKLNAALRKGRYKDDLFKTCTNRSLDELWAEYVGSSK
jgi:formylglycine-generating enzyme required for sulfatase activity